MDFPSENSKANHNQLDLFSTVLQTVRNFVGRLIGFFILTDEERLKAGIGARSEGRDR
jgi:hypothetical protein